MGTTTTTTTTDNSYQIIMVGNPGSGKSTIGSTFAKTRQFFESGVEFGIGKTKTYESKQLPDGNYISDTPGLEDIQNRKKALSNSSPNNKTRSIYKILHVYSLESGRVRPADLVTINIILKALDKDAKYNMVINKILRKTAKTLLTDDKMKANFLNPLANMLYRMPSSIAFIYLDKNAIEQNNELLESAVTICNNELTVIKEEISIHEMVQYMENTSYEVNSVKDLELINYDKDVENMETMILNMKETNSNLKDTIIKLKEKAKNLNHS